MRWLFIQPPDSDDVHAREVAREGIARWWQSFMQHREAIVASFRRGGPEFDLVTFMKEQLQAIHPGLMWEFGPAIEKDGHRLIITPEGALELRPMVDELIRAAPELSDWEFGAYRLPDLASFTMLVESRARRPAEGLVGKVRRGTLGRIDLAWTRRGADDLSAEELAPVAFVATEILLGEELLDHWIGLIEPIADPEAPWVRAGEEAKEDDRPWLELEPLAEAVRALRAELEAERPEQSCAERFDHSLWVALRMEPERAEDYPLFEDQLTGQTMALEMWQTARRGLRFHSPRFSRHGERFATLKIDVEDRDDAERVATRSQLEDVLQPRLAEAAVGSITGAGLGLRYDYIDLALSDVETALPLIRGVLRRAEVAKRSWILFFDSEWRDEWVGIWDDSPPPPRKSEG